MGYRVDKQVIDTHTQRHTDTRTDTQTQAMTIPEGQNWPRVKTDELIRQDIIEKVEGPTPWLNPVVVVPKSDGV